MKCLVWMLKIRLVRLLVVYLRTESNQANYIKNVIFIIKCGPLSENPASLHNPDFEIFSIEIIRIYNLAQILITLINNKIITELYNNYNIPSDSQE